MRARSSWLSHPKFKATWVALAAGSLAGLAVLGACSDAPVSKVAGPNIPSPRFVGATAVGANHHKILVCVDPTGDPAPGGGTFSFAIAANLAQTAFGGRLELPSSNDPVVGNNITQTNTGPFIPGDIITTSASIADGDPCVEVFVRMNTCPGSNPTAVPPVLGICGDNLPFDNAGNRLWTCNAGAPCSGIINPSGAVSITGTIPAGYSFTLTCVNEDILLPHSCVNGGYASANVFHGASFTFRFTAPTVTGPCVLPNAVFGLGAARPFTLLGLDGNVFEIGSPGTLVVGDAGFGPNNTGTVKKATVDGNLTKDPTSTVNIVSDFKVTGLTTIASLVQASLDATSASAALNALVANQTVGNLTANQSFTTAGGTKVIDIASVNMQSKTLTITGDADDVFIFNVAGGFNFRSSQMILAGGVRPSNIIWNFTGTTGDVIIKDPSTRAFGVFLAPDRNFNGDKSTIVGALMVGQSILIHSGTQLICEET